MNIAIVVMLAAAAQAVEVGVAKISGTKDAALKGQARLEAVKGGLKLSVTVGGLPRDGEFAMHVHEFGDCADEAKAAGQHYNPEGAPHGHALKDGKKAHPGDLGNVVAKGGTISFEAVLPRASLTGAPRAVAGRSIVLHEKADDFSQPVGNAGGRIACGVIERRG